jgi:hypothetical protein
LTNGLFIQTLISSSLKKGKTGSILAASTMEIRRG